MKEGNGVYYYTNGNKYEGGWKNDLKHGHGVYYNFVNGEKYEGQWVSFYSNYFIFNKI